MLEEIHCKQKGTKLKKSALADARKRMTGCGQIKPIVRGEVREPGLSTQCEVVSSASSPIMSDFVQPTATLGKTRFR